jgi:SNF2 family DNA or RNA helicase
MARQFAFDAIQEHPEFVVICNYEAWRRDKELLDQLTAFNFDTVIIDEAHNIKNMKSGAYKGIKQIIDNSNPEYIIPMTGTPILNRPQELFTLLTLVNPERFHTLNDFLWDFCEQDQFTGYWKFKDGGIDRISKQISKNFLRRTRDQAGIKLPPKTIIEHNITVDKEAYPLQEKVREQMRKYASILVDESKHQAISAVVKIAVFTRLRQIETWPAAIHMKDPITKEIKFSVDVEESQKLDYVISPAPDEFGNYTGLIAEAIDDERMVLFSQFKAPLYEIKRRVEQAGYRAVVLDGNTPESVRDEVAMDFDRRNTPERSDAKWDIALCNYRVGGVGLNLTAATQMIILDEEWNPGKRDQAYDRLHRMGQTESVTIHLIRAKDTIDDWLAGIMEAKEGVVEGFNSKMEDLSLEGFLKWEGDNDKGGLA